MPDPAILKLVSIVEEICFVGDQAVDPPVRRAVVVAVTSNPLAGRHVEDLTALAVFGEMLGMNLGRRALQLLNNGKRQIASYGKAALVGVRGEVEHGAAVLHPRLGVAVRAVIGHATTLMPSVTKVGPAGASLDVPLHSVRDQWSVDHFDSISIAVPDAPGPEELMIVVAMSDGGRPLARTLMQRS